MLTTHAAYLGPNIHHADNLGPIIRHGKPFCHPVITSDKLGGSMA